MFDSLKKIVDKATLATIAILVIEKILLPKLTELKEKPQEKVLKKPPIKNSPTSR